MVHTVKGPQKCNPLMKRALLLAHTCQFLASQAYIILIPYCSMTFYSWYVLDALQTYLVTKHDLDNFGMQSRLTLEVQIGAWFYIRSQRTSTSHTMGMGYRSLISVFIAFYLIGSATAQGRCRCKRGRLLNLNVRRFSIGEIDNLVNEWKSKEKGADPKCSTTCNRGSCPGFNRMSCIDYRVTRNARLIVFCRRRGTPGRRCIVRSQAENDPHITGFDGSKFDFHGVPNRKYAIFGRIGGEMLVANMRASGYRLWRPYVAKTYFSEFGFQSAADGPKVRIAMVPDGKAWRSQVTVDGQVVTRNYVGKDTSVMFPAKNRVHVITAETKYRFALMRPTDMRHRHLNVDMELLTTPMSAHQYVGVVGMTLNRALGHNVHKGLAVEDMRTSIRKFGSNPARSPFKWSSKMEYTMRRFFEVDNLFPPVDTNTAVLGGISARFVLSAGEHTNVTPKRMIATIS